MLSYKSFLYEESKFCFIFLFENPSQLIKSTSPDQFHTAINEREPIFPEREVVVFVSV